MRWPRRRSSGRHAALPVQRAVSWATPALPPDAAVRLGFVDGTEIELNVTDPRARALRSVADLLVQDSAVTADN